MLNKTVLVCPSDEYFYMTSSTDSPEDD